MQTVRDNQTPTNSNPSHKNSLEENLNKYPLLPPCRCRKHCYNLFSQQARIHIHRSYWTLDHFSRSVWILNRIKSKPVAKLKKPTTSGTNRSCVRLYYLELSLKIDNPEMVNVCQRFFLSTLGYKSDKIITYTLKVFKDLQDTSKCSQVTQTDSKCKIKPDSSTSPSVSHSSATHPMLPPCTCKQQCATKLPEEERRAIHARYWDMSYSDRKHWLYSCVKSLPVQRRTKPKSSASVQRSCSRQYFFPRGNGENLCVCQKFFLSTLGYSHDKIIGHTVSTLSQSSTAQLASSGRKSKNKLSAKITELVRKHISNNAAEFKKRPIKKLYEEFIASNSRLKKKPSYESYRLFVCEMNVRGTPKHKPFDSSGRFKGKTELDMDELHYFEDLDLYSPNLGYSSYLEQLSSTLPVEIPLQFPATPKSLQQVPEEPSGSGRQAARQHPFLLMQGSSQEMGHLVTSDNLIML